MKRSTKKAAVATVSTPAAMNTTAFTSVPAIVSVAVRDDRVRADGECARTGRERKHENR